MGPRSPEEFEYTHSPELAPKECLGEILYEHNGRLPATDIPTRAHVVSETVTSQGTICELECEECGAGSVVLHDGQWNIKRIAEPQFGPTLSTCPKIELQT